MFTYQQKAMIKKAVKEARLNNYIAGGQQAVLLLLEPSGEDAITITEDVVLIAFGIGLQNEYLNENDRNKKREMAAVRLRKMITAYAGSVGVCKTCFRVPPEGMDGTWDGNCGTCVERAFDIIN